MTTIHPRITFTTSKDLFRDLNALADKRKTSVSALVKDLTQKALELEEDRQLSDLGDNLLAENNADFISHEDIWKKHMK